ncbi:hypothetical protein [Mycolicibacterium austroafricanum]|uniref:hypothetical protein n=1 Tax=Mycolicibacterium austroafricanum TaxID=39687 RepID=UPI001CA32258|nr:hypothetical protein [Mycolicibacterium austroafricanum]QZT62882.1 hypothetical protein JN085_00195 [Mycolicibacterium austroafricanum]
MRTRAADASDHVTGVRRALTTAALYFAAVAPATQFLAFQGGTPPYPDQVWVWAVFAAHAVVWVCALLRWLPTIAVLISWTAIALTLAAQSAAAGALEPVGPRNVAMTIAACAALLLPTGAAVVTVIAVSAGTAAALVLGAPSGSAPVWNAAVEVPVYAIGVAVALALAFRVLYAVAGEADAQAGARLAVDRTVRRRELSAEAARRRARRMHDTIINTLGAIATARITSADALVSRRCAEDALSAEQLRNSAAVVNPGLDDVFVRASELGVALIGSDIDALRRRLDAEEPWRRREIVATLCELVTNVAKHAGVSEATLSYDAATRTATVSDAGVGVADVAVLEAALSARGQDSATESAVVSADGVGTSVSVCISPVPDDAGGVFETASARMATAVAVVMLCQFALNTVVALTFDAGWTRTACSAPLAMWLIAATVLVVMTRRAAQRRTLPPGAVAVAYLGLVAMVMVYRLAGSEEWLCGLQPTLAWAGDAVATIFAVMVMVDGRIRVIAPAVVLTTVAVGELLSRAGTSCTAITFAMFVTDVLVIGAFYILRHQTLRLSSSVARDVDDQIRRREQQERSAIAEALDKDGFDSSLAHARQILTAVAENPRRAGDPQTRTAAGLEEGYLRALIRLTAGIVTPTATRRFVGLIDNAREAGIGLAVHADPGVLDDESAGIVVDAMTELVRRCTRGDELSVGIFGPATAPSMMIVAPPRALVGYPHGRKTVELGLVEVRWSVGAHRRN